jgi:hypothetical protein
MLLMDSFKKAKPLVLTVFFGFGKVAATVGSTFYAIDSMLSSYGIKESTNITFTIKLISALTSGLAIAMTRLPEMMAKFSGSGEVVEYTLEHPAHKRAKLISIFIGCMGYLASVLAGISGLLGGKTLAKELTEDEVAASIFGFYVALSAFMSFAIYSVVKSRQSSYEFMLNSSDLKCQNISSCDKALLKTISSTGICVVSSASMFYFSTQNSIPAMLEIFNLPHKNAKVFDIIAALSILPSESTLIFSQVAAVKKYFSTPQQLISNQPEELRRKIVMWMLIILNTLSIIPQGLVYYEYMDDLLGEKIPVSARIPLSVLNGLSASFLYFAFTIIPAIKNSNKLANTEITTNFTRCLPSFFRQKNEGKQRIGYEPINDAEYASSSSHIQTLNPSETTPLNP